MDSEATRNSETYFELRFTSFSCFLFNAMGSSSRNALVCFIVCALLKIKSFLLKEQTAQSAEIEKTAIKRMPNANWIQIEGVGLCPSNMSS